MGHEVERAARTAGDHIVSIFDIEPLPSAEGLRGAEVCIEFSTPEAVLNHMRLAAETGIDIVVGTTGWYEHLDEVRDWFTDSAMLYAQNFSIGVNVFYRILRRAAELMEPLSQYDVCVDERHHTGKLDSPSGTAMRISDILLGELTRKTRILAGSPAGPIAADQLQIVSVRSGHMPGSHRVDFDSEADSIELLHVAKNRSGFAVGALEAARWVRGRKGVFTMDDVEL